MQDSELLFAWTVLRVLRWRLDKVLLRREDSEAGLPSECPAGIRFINIRVVLTDVDCQVFGRMTVDTEADRTDSMLSVDICRNW